MKHNVDFAVKPRFEILDGLRGVAFHLLESYCGGDHTNKFYEKTLATERKYTGITTP